MSKTILTEIDLYLPQLPSHLEGLRILHLSDIHSRGMHPPQKAALQIARQPCDLCLVTGDTCCELRIPNPLYIASSPSRKVRRPGLSWYGYHFALKIKPALEFCKQLVQDLNSPAPPYFIPGNHDPEEFFSQVPLLGIVTLKNQNLILDLPQRGPINLIGLNCLQRLTVDIPNTLIQRRPEIFSIALAHYPELAPTLAAANLDIVLSGHTHAGQIRALGKFPLVTHSHIGNYLNSGLNFINNTVIYTSRGLGESLLPIRLHCPPEITRMTLHQGPITQTQITTTPVIPDAKPPTLTSTN